MLPSGGIIAIKLNYYQYYYCRVFDAFIKSLTKNKEVEKKTKENKNKQPSTGKCYTINTQIQFSTVQYGKVQKLHQYNSTVRYRAVPR